MNLGCRRSKRSAEGRGPRRARLTNRPGIGQGGCEHAKGGSI